jgi:uncharacterized membrane protein YuzA (DUF378 family)
VDNLITPNPAMFVSTLSYVLYGILAVCLVLLLAKRSSRKSKSKSASSGM